MKNVIDSMRDTWQQQLQQLREMIPTREQELRAMKQAERDLARNLKESDDMNQPKSKSPTGAVVKSMVLDLLRENEVLHSQEIYDLVEDGLKEQGFDAKGLRLRLMEAFSMPELTQDRPGYFSISNLPAHNEDRDA